MASSISSGEARFPEAKKPALLELRAATDLARLWRDTGSPNDPRALILEVPGIVRPCASPEPTGLRLGAVE